MWKCASVESWPCWHAQSAARRRVASPGASKKRSSASRKPRAVAGHQGFCDLGADPWCPPPRTPLGAPEGQRATCHAVAQARRVFSHTHGTHCCAMLSTPKAQHAFSS